MVCKTTHNSALLFAFDCLLQGIFCAFVEPLVESENIQSKSNGGEKKDQFKIVFKDVQPVRIDYVKTFVLNDNSSGSKLNYIHYNGH